MLSKAQEEYHKGTANTNNNHQNPQQNSHMNSSNASNNHIIKQASDSQANLSHKLSNMFIQQKQPDQQQPLQQVHNPQMFHMANFFAAAHPNGAPPPSIQQVPTVDEIEKQQQKRVYSPINVQSNTSKLRV